MPQFCLKKCVKSLEYRLCSGSAVGTVGGLGGGLRGQYRRDTSWQCRTNAVTGSIVRSGGGVLRKGSCPPIVTILYTLCSRHNYYVVARAQTFMLQGIYILTSAHIFYVINMLKLLFLFTVGPGGVK